MISDAIKSSKSDEYTTPDYLFTDLDNEFHFDLDPCSTDENCKCVRHYTAEQDGLHKDWGGVVYSAILRTVRYPNGCRSAMKKVSSPGHLSSC